MFFHHGNILRSLRTVVSAALLARGIQTSEYCTTTMPFPQNRILGNSFRVFLVGDVMLGRGVDQTLRFKVNPRLFEDYVKDARDYVTLAINTNGPLPENRTAAYTWGDGIQILKDASPDVRIINLETSVTERGTPWPNKGIHYRMHPDNLEVVKAASIDCCVLSNNHVLDWSYQGLTDTLSSLKQQGIKTVGAGENLVEATRPAEFTVPGKSGRILVFGVGHWSSGVPSSWRASESRAGVYQIDSLGDNVEAIRTWVAKHKRSGDIAILSIHWGSNWDWDLESGHRNFAHRMIDEAGVDLIHGHSSHHIKGVEVHNRKLIIYGCGDFISDYEGINGGTHGKFRDDVSFMYFVDMNGSGELVDLLLAPMRLKQLRVMKAGKEDSEWLYANMKRECRRFGGDIEKLGDLFRLVTT